MANKKLLSPLWLCSIIAAGCGGVVAVGTLHRLHVHGRGTVSGLQGSGLRLQISGGADLTITASDAFVLPGTLQSGASYAVTVASQPNDQTCSVASGVRSATPTLPMSS